jgi:uncharacterized protein (TIGR02246 family)
VAALTTVTMAGCARPQPAPETRTASERAAVEAATAAFHESLRANDLAAFMSFVADDVVMAPPGEAPLHGRAQVRAWTDAFMQLFRTSSLTLSDKEVLVGDGFAVERGSYEWHLVPRQGGEPLTDRGSYMQVWTRTPDGQWRFAREVYNSSVPPVAP